MSDEEFKKMLRRVALWPVGAMVFLGLLLVGLIQFLLSSAESVEHTDRVIAQAYALESRLVDMETGVRGYQVTGDAVFLEPYERANKEIAGELQTLRELVSDNANQVEAERMLRQRVEAWQRFADEALNRRRGGTDSAETSFNLRGKELMDAVRASVVQFGHAEERLRSTRALARDRIRRGLLGIIFLAVFILGPGGGIMLRRFLRRTTQSFRESTEAAQRRAEELRVTLRSIGDAVIATDQEGRVAFLNPVAEQLTGWPTKEASGKPLTEIFHIFNEQTGAVAENPVERVLREKKVIGLANHTVLRSRDGREIPIADSAAPIRGDADEMHGVILVFHDVTEARGAQREIRESRERLQAALTGSGAGIFSWEIATNALEWDENLNCLCALPPGETVRSLDEFVALLHPDDRPDFLAQCERCAHEGVDFDQEFRLVRADGSLRWLHERGKTLRGPDDKPLRMTGACVDVTERRVAEQTAREAADRFRFMAESMPQKIFTARPNGDLDYCNREWLKYTGLSFEQMRDWGWVHIIHPEDVDENIRLWQRSLDTGKPFYFEHRFLRLDGEYRWHVSRAVPMRNSHDQIAMWIGSNTDIEDVRRAKEHAERASRAKDEFLAALSHELRTPLTPVLMTAGVLAHDERLPQDVRDELAMIERNVELEARLIDDLLDLTRITHGKLQLRQQPCDAHSLIAHAVEMVRSEAQSKRQKLQIDLAAKHSQLYCDPARMQQVFWNLLKNAVKFTPELGQVIVRSREADGRIVLEVSDSGMGIPAEALERIFLPFEQADPNAHDHRRGGLGLGLSISKAILQLHGGTIEAESAGPGRGSVFRVALPATETPAAPNVADGDAAADAPARSGARREPARALRLLVVEDHQPTLVVLERLLTRAGHSVTTAMSVARALEIADGSEKFDVVLSDVGLPDGTGFELMAKLRERHALRGIALSGYGMDEDLRRSKEAGFSAHLTKPIDFAQLEEALAEIISETLQS